METFTGFAGVDTETTGLSPALDRIIEIAVVCLDVAKAQVDQWTTLLNPDRGVGRTDIHHISPADVAHAPRFSDIASELATVLSGRVIVGHNIQFDAGFLVEEFHRAGYKKVTLPYDACIDTMSMVSAKLSLENLKLATCCQALDITNQFPHSALGDALATAELFRALEPLPWCGDRIQSAQALLDRRTLWPLQPSKETTFRTEDGTLVTNERLEQWADEYENENPKRIVDSSHRVTRPAFGYPRFARDTRNL